MTASTPPGIWLLRAEGKGNLNLVPHDLEYFQSHFVTNPMAKDWKPPIFDVLGKSKKLRDFVGLMISAPAVSDRVRVILEPMCKGDVEFLPIQSIRGKAYFAMNVLRTEDVLDLPSCDSLLCGSKIVSIRKFAFRRNLSNSLPAIFKAPQLTGDIFVTEAFKNCALEKNFTGLALADPGQDNFAKTIRGGVLNVVPGIFE